MLFHGRKMSFRDVLRSAFRSYEEISVSRSTLQSLIEATALLPDSIDPHPWEFRAFSDEKNMDGSSDRPHCWLRQKIADNPAAKTDPQDIHFDLPDPLDSIPLLPRATSQTISTCDRRQSAACSTRAKHKPQNETQQTVPEPVRATGSTERRTHDQDHESRGSSGIRKASHD
jgi:hypothetical protein